MTETKTLILRKANLFYFSILLSLAVFAPLLKFQLISGSLVNAVLFISTAILGLEGALLICLIPSLIALGIGLLPSVLAPMIPFIIVSNAIFVLIFNFLRKKSYWLGIISASFIKFLFLFNASSLMFELISKKEIAVKAASMMSWPQLITALSGGLIAYIFLKAAKKI
jgi:hypothetical protein